MTNEQMLILGGVIIAAMVAVIVFTIVWDLRKNKEKYESEVEENMEKTFAEEAEILTMHAEIVDMVCGTGMVGSYRLPKSVRTFLIIFKNDAGEVLEISVSEEVYLSLERGMRGMLTLCEGNLDSFDLDEK